MNPLIRRLIKYEERLNAELFKKMQSDKSFVGVFRPVRLFVIYEQLLCMSIQTNGILRYGQSAYTPTLLSDVLDGNFDPEEIEQAIQALEDIGLIKIDESRSIILTCFSQDIPTTTDSLSVDNPLPEEKNQETKEDKPQCSPCVQLLIREGYLFEDDSKNKKKSKISDFENYIANLQNKNSKLTPKELYQMIQLFLKDMKDSGTGPNAITSKIAYFMKSIEKSLKDKNQSEVKNAVASIDYDWHDF